MAYLFERRAVVAGKVPCGMDPVEAALEAGADDVVEGGDGAVRFLAAPPSLGEMEQRLRQLGVEATEVRVVTEAGTTVVMDGGELAAVWELAAALEECEGVHRVCHNAVAG